MTEQTINPENDDENDHIPLFDYYPVKNDIRMLADYMDDKIQEIFLDVNDAMRKRELEEKKSISLSSGKKVLLEHELNKLKNDTGLVYDMQLSDLVMMQMAGDFDHFIDSLGEVKSKGDFDNIISNIEDTKNKVTNTKLFSSIVKKTIESQFGDTTATIRELGQNAIDSYHPADDRRLVRLLAATDGDYHCLTVRDYGAGMNLQELVKDLLIPYNSGKEFDPGKIGEHGIGWFSIVDIADVVKVTTRKKFEETGTQALIYFNDDNWVTSIAPISPNGFDDRMDTIDGKMAHWGTEVLAYIPKGKVSINALRNSAYQHLGMVDFDDFDILMGKRKVNSNRREYLNAKPQDVRIGNDLGKLSLGVSKRNIRGNIKDPRFYMRDRNLDKILFTQKGLFVKYDSIPFADETIHRKLVSKMIDNGLDFWIDLPKNAKLTKGRNNVIADHANCVLEASYKAFEDTFLDIILTDTELLSHSSGMIMESIADLFDRSYSGTLSKSSKNKISLRRRAMSSAAKVGGTLVDMLDASGELFVRSSKYMATKFPKKVLGWGVSGANYLADNGKTIGKVALIGTGLTGVGFAALAGGYALVNYLSEIWPDWYYYIGGAVGGIVGLGLSWKAGVEIKRLYKKIKEDWNANPLYLASGTSDFSITDSLKRTYEYVKESFSNIGNVLYDVMHNITDIIKNATGLYVDVDKKRDKKREKVMKKITEKYLSRMHRDEFLSRIMRKKIIPALFVEPVFSGQRNNIREKKGNKMNIGDYFDNFLGLNKIKNNRNFYRTENVSYVVKVNKENTKLSIDQLVNAYIMGILHVKNKYKTCGEYTPSMDTYIVDYTNPLVNRIVDIMDGMDIDIKNKYDVKLMEDYLDKISRFGKKTLLAAYFISGLGIMHAFVSDYSKKVKNPYKKFKPYTSLKNKAIAVSDWAQKKDFDKMFGKLALGTIKLPYTILKGIFSFSAAIVGGVYKGMLVPIGRAIDPRKYPEYYENYKIKLAHNRKRKKERRLEQKIAEEELLKSQKEHLEKISYGFYKRLWKDFKKEFSVIYRYSLIYNIFGVGEVPFRKFNKTIDEVADLADKATAGYAYVDYMCVIDKVSSIISDALLEPKPALILSGNDARFRLHMLDWKKKTLTIYYDKNDGFQESHLISALGGSSVESGYGYILLEEMLHSKAHAKMGKSEYTDSCTSYKMFGTKDEMRDKVLDYMKSNNIVLDDAYLRSLCRDPEKIHDLHYDIYFSTLEALNKLTKRSLMLARIDYSDKREKYLAQQKMTQPINTTSE